MKNNMKVITMIVRESSFIKRTVVSALICAFTFFSVMPAADATVDPEAVLEKVSTTLEKAGKVFKKGETEHVSFCALPLEKKDTKLEKLEKLTRDCELALADIEESSLSQKLQLRYRWAQERISVLQHKVADSQTGLEEIREFHERYEKFVRELKPEVIERSGIPRAPKIEEMSAEFLQAAKRKVNAALEQITSEKVEEIRAEDSQPPSGRFEAIGHALMAGLRKNFASPQEFLRVADWTAKRLAGGFISALDEKGEEALGSFSDALKKHSKGFLKATGQSFNREMDRASKTAARNLEKKAESVLKSANAAVTEAGKSINAAQETFMKQFIGWGSTGLVTFGGIGIGLYAAYRYAAMGMKALEKPGVIEETNIPVFKKGIAERFGFKSLEAEERPYPLFSDIILDSETKQEFTALKFAINNIKESKGIFRNILLWGNPGTGKTMSARALAHETYCYWMFLTGSSLFKMDEVSHALQEIDAMFKFAESQTKPVIIIFDEADILFEARENLSENTRKIMMHIMQKMGTESSKFLIVAVTNKPAVFDEAMRSRFSKQVEVKLPGAEQRAHILKKYVERDFALKPHQLVVFDDALVSSIALMTKGYSGRSLMFLIAGIRDAFASSGLQELTPEFIQAVVRKEVAERLKEQTGFTREAVLS